jgi:demethylmenaquinone methyltransferase/2-methoxy-6-polyprenyl-1,4-benzoquinol methylase
MMNRLFTFGQDQKWRMKTAIRCLEFKPEKVLDLCCGTGDLAIAIKKRSGNETDVVGLDFNALMLEMACKKVLDKEIGMIEFVQGDAASLPFSDESFDCVTIGFGFRNLTFRNTNSIQHLSEIHRVLRADGNLLILESSVPSNSFIGFFYSLYLKYILIPLGGLITGSWKAYNYLSRSSLNFFKQADLEKLLNENRFHIFTAIQFFFGAANLIVAKKE